MYCTTTAPMGGCPVRAPRTLEENGMPYHLRGAAPSWHRAGTLTQTVWMWLSDLSAHPIQR